jgi:trimeric autotransporter adhesin
MKTYVRFIALIGFVVMITTANAQTPQAFNYQTVVRNTSGEIVQNQNVAFRFNVRENLPDGPIVYSETHVATTNSFGLVNLKIGEGIPLNGIFSEVDWGTNSKFLEIEIDLSGGDDFIVMGTTQLISVPYALFAENVANKDDADADPANELQNLSLDGNELSISDGNTVTLSGSGNGNRISDDDGNTWVDAELNSNNDSIIFTTMGMERMVISHNGYVEVNGQMIATGFQGDGSGLTGVPGDDLGNHTANEELDMANHRIVNLVSPNVPNDAATKLYVDTQVSLSEDNLGDHTATQNIALDNNWISNDGDDEGIFISVGGKVGINTLSPDETITVDGNIKSNSIIMTGFGSADYASYRFGAGTENTGFASPYANAVSVITDGSEKMVIRQNGNVGIGNTDPGATLDVSGHIWQKNLGGSVFLGYQAGENDDLSDNKNVAVGYQALQANTSGSNNCATGFMSMPDNTTGENNIAYGFASLYENTGGSGNSANGYRSLYSNTTGNDNTAYGNRSLYNNTIGGGNIAIGVRALYCNTDRSNLVAVGDSALYHNGTGAYYPYHATGNTAFGSKALFSNTIGFYNTANGYQALSSNTMGAGNVATGMHALYSNTTGSNNTANGADALYSNTTGSHNAATGVYALLYNTTGANNTATGVKALRSNTTGDNNTATGVWALYTNQANSRSTAIGYGAMTYADDRTTGRETFNTAVGYEALRGSATASNNTGRYNTANGDRALYSNTMGDNNTANGCHSLFFNINGYSNTAMGTHSLYRNTDRSNLVAVGDSALFNNGVGVTITYQAARNTAMGSKALYANNVGDQNTASGYESLFSNEGGYFNSAFGCQALYQNVSGLKNTAIGNAALINNVSGSNNTALGFGAYSGSGNYSNSTAIGYSSSITASNQIRLGNTSITSIGGFANWTNLSDGRFKKNVENNVPGLDFIMKLQPVTYQLDIAKLDQSLRIEKGDRDDYDLMQNAIKEKENIIQTGFIAQDVEAVAKSLGFKFSGIDVPENENDYYGLRYAEFVVPLVKAIQEQQVIIEALKLEIEKLKND